MFACKATISQDSNVPIDQADEADGLDRLDRSNTFNEFAVHGVGDCLAKRPLSLASTEFEKESDSSNVEDSFIRAVKPVLDIFS